VGQDSVQINMFALSAECGRHVETRVRHDDHKAMSRGCAGSHWAANHQRSSATAKWSRTSLWWTVSSRCRTRTPLCVVTSPSGRYRAHQQLRYALPYRAVLGHRLPSHRTL